MSRFALLAALVCAAFPCSAQGADYFWNNTGSSFSSSGSWTPGGLPGSSDTVYFTPSGAPLVNPVIQPTIDANGTIGTLVLAPTSQLGGWTFSGSNVLTINSGLNAYGPATYTFDGPSIQGPPAANSLLNITNGSTVVFRGNSAVVSNAGPVILNGGTLLLDNSTSVINRLPSNADFRMRSGTLEVRGHSTLSAQPSLGALDFANGLRGLNTIRLVPGGGSLSVNFNNTGSFSTQTASAAIRVEASSGILGGGGASNPKMTFTGAPFVAENGLLSDSGGTAYGHFTVSDANGIDFATWNATDGIKAAGNNFPATMAPALASATVNSRVSYTPGNASNATGNITAGSMRITPTASGGILGMNTFNLQTNALMLNGDRDFTITSNSTTPGTWASGNISRYVYVNNPSAILSTGLVIASGNASSATNIVGPGFLELTRNGSQNTATSGRINLLGGVLRASNTQLGSGGALVFEGGVLEIKDGGTLSRTLNADGGSGTVRWDGGNGGFSAFGGPASVNISNGATLIWNSGGFVGDGYALTFGSIISNATINFTNPIQLDTGGGQYALREISVTRGDGSMADHTILGGSISGSSTSDLIKTGNGTLEMIAPNSYQGNTIIQAGTLTLAGVNVNLGEGNVIVGKGAVLAGIGTITPTAGKEVVVNPGGAIRGGNLVALDQADHLGALTINSNLTINSTATDRGTIQIETHRVTSGTASASQIALGANNHLNLNPGVGNKFVIELVTSSLTSPLQIGEHYAITIATVSSSGTIMYNGTSLSNSVNIPGVIQNGVLDPSLYVIQSASIPAFTNVQLTIGADDHSLDLSFTPSPVPEPTTTLALAAAVLGATGLIRRQRRSHPSIAPPV